MMAGEVDDSITHQSDCLPSGSISFGRFDLESLSWERRSSFSHNRYLEEVEKYSTPGSVTKKKEYFEAHFKKKALLQQLLVENQKDTETGHTESVIVDNDGAIEDVIYHGNNELVEVSWDDRDAPTISDEHEAAEPQKEEMSSAELNTGFPSFNSEKYTELFNEPLASDVTVQSQVGDNGAHLDEGNFFGIVDDKTVDANVNSKKLAENGDASSKICVTKKKNESIQTRSQKISMKASDTVELKARKSQNRAHLPTQQMSNKPSRSGNFVSYGKIKKADKQITLAKPEKGIPSKVSSPTSTENGNFKVMASRNMKAKPRSEIKSEEGVRAKKAEVMPRQVERRSDVRQPVNRVKLFSKTDDKQTSAVFKLKSSERAEKRKDYYLKLEEKLHAKEAEMNEIQARTEEVKEAEMKQFRKSLNFKATPMPSFYHETATKASEGKKTSTTQPSHENSLPPPSSSQEISLLCEPHCSTRLGPSISSAINKVEPTEMANYSAKRPDGSKREEKGKFNSSQNQGNDMRKKGESKSGMRSGAVTKVKGIVGGNLTVHVAS